jgi:hypothetical protein
MPVWYPPRCSSVATVVRELSNRLNIVTPFRCEYCPVRMLARLGVQMEFVANTFASSAPSRASRSRCGVSLTCEP